MDDEEILMIGLAVSQGMELSHVAHALDLSTEEHMNLIAKVAMTHLAHVATMSDGPTMANIRKQREAFFALLPDLTEKIGEQYLEYFTAAARLHAKGFIK